MGKNAAHKQQQRARHSATDEAGAPEVGDGTVDASFHSPAWHAARIAALTTERMSWADFKKKQKEADSLEASAAADEEARMREYRAQLDADRAAKLAKGTNHAHFRDTSADDPTSAGGKRKREHKSKERSGKRSKHKKDGGKKSDKDKHKKSKSHKSQQRKDKKRKRSSSSSRSSDSSSDSKHD